MPDLFNKRDPCKDPWPDGRRVLVADYSDGGWGMSFCYSEADAVERVRYQLSRRRTSLIRAYTVPGSVAVGLTWYRNVRPDMPGAAPLEI